MATVQLLLLDDHVLFREGLDRLLSTESDFEVVAQCGTLSDALDSIARQRIDLVLLDFDLGEETGTSFIGSARLAGYAGPILLVTAGVSPIDGSLLRGQGISGIFLKHGSPAALLDAIRMAAAGGAWTEPQGEGRTSFHPSLHSGGDGLLTDREHQVLRCIFEGLINKQIAKKLGISESSVKATLQHLFDKAGVRTRGQLVRFAIERSLEDEPKLI